MYKYGLGDAGAQSPVTLDTLKSPVGIAAIGAVLGAFLLKKRKRTLGVLLGGGAGYLIGHSIEQQRQAAAAAAAAAASDAANEIAAGMGY